MSIMAHSLRFKPREILTNRVPAPSASLDTGLDGHVLPGGRISSKRSSTGTFSPASSILPTGRQLGRNSSGREVGVVEELVGGRTSASLVFASRALHVALVPVESSVQGGAIPQLRVAVTG
jgi:hypothetical protein